MSSTYAYRVNAKLFFFRSEETASDPARLNNGGRIETAEKCVDSLSQRTNVRGEITFEVTQSIAIGIANVTFHVTGVFMYVNFISFARTTDFLADLIWTNKMCQFDRLPSN